MSSRDSFWPPQHQTSAHGDPDSSPYSYETPESYGSGWSSSRSPISSLITSQRSPPPRCVPAGTDYSISSDSLAKLHVSSPSSLGSSSSVLETPPAGSSPPLASHATNDPTNWGWLTAQEQEAVIWAVLGAPYQSPPSPQLLEEFESLMRLFSGCETITQDESTADENQCVIPDSVGNSHSVRSSEGLVAYNVLNFTQGIRGAGGAFSPPISVPHPQATPRFSYPNEDEANYYCENQYQADGFRSISPTYSAKLAREQSFTGSIRSASSHESGLTVQKNLSNPAATSGKQNRSDDDDVVENYYSQSTMDQRKKNKMEMSAQARCEAPSPEMERTTKRSPPKRTKSASNPSNPSIVHSTELSNTPPQNGMVTYPTFCGQFQSIPSSEGEDDWDLIPYDPSEYDAPKRKDRNGYIKVQPKIWETKEVKAQKKERIDLHEKRAYEERRDGLQVEPKPLTMRWNQKNGTLARQPLRVGLNS